MEHSFTEKIKEILTLHFGENGKNLFKNSELIQYLNFKTKSAEKGSKARSSFANLYAIYVLIEDYLAKGFAENEHYSKYEGAEFARLFTRQRELPFGEKLQNHALNNRLNSEFQKFFPNSEFIPILRNLETNRYWINENLLKVETEKRIFNIANSTIEIIDAYIKSKQDAFQRFIQTCEELQKIGSESSEDIRHLS